MSWYSLYEIATGRLHSHSSSAADPVPDGMAQAEDAERKDQGGFTWSQTNKQWEKDAPQATKVSSREFIGRFTVDEAVSIKLAAEAGVPAAKQAAFAFEFARDRGFVELTPKTAGMLDGLVLAGLLTEKRKGEILS